jgi:type I restriction enzyme M protein
MGIVLPQSILSNRSLERVRGFLIARCSIDGVLSLPGEAFGPFHGVGKASVLFLTRAPADGGTVVRLGVSRSIGWDKTGKPKGVDDTRATALAMKLAVPEPRRVGQVAQSAALARNLTAEWLMRPRVEGRALGDLCSAIFNGRTPVRAAYAPGAPGDVYRVLKVGDLTSHGIDWSVGERSLARLARPPRETRLLRMGDLATTAAAHHPRYIGAKVDFVDCLPAGLEDRCMPVNEVLVLRPDPEAVDPLVLLLWLRSDEGREAVQSCVTGQTAHLHAADVADVVVPSRVLRASYDEAIAPLRRSLELRRESEAAAELALRRFAALS